MPGATDPDRVAESSHGWSAAQPVVQVGPHPIRPGRGGGLFSVFASDSRTRRFLRPYRGGCVKTTHTPRVPLRSTRGNSPQPLRGQEVYSSPPPDAPISLIEQLINDALNIVAIE